MSGFLCESPLSYPEVKMEVQVNYKSKVYFNAKFILFW